MPAEFREVLITVSEVAKMANRSAVTVRRWIAEGLLLPAFTVPTYNGAIMLDKDEVEARLPEILELMASRPGGRGRKKDTA